MASKGRIVPKPNRRGTEVWLALSGNKVRLVDARGIDVTERVNKSVKVTLQKQLDQIVGKVILSDSEGNLLDLSEGLKVQDPRLRASNNRIGTVSGILKTVSDHKILVGGAAAALDVLSESASTGTAWRFQKMARVNGGGGVIIQAHALLQTTALTPRLVLFLFRAKPTSNLLDNAPNTAVILADMEIAIPPISFPAMEDIGTGVSWATATPSTVGDIPIAFTCAADSRDLWGIVATRDGVTPTALDKLLIGFSVEQY